MGVNVEQEQYITYKLLIKHKNYSKLKINT